MRVQTCLVTQRKELLALLFCSGLGLSKLLQEYRSCERLCTIPSSAHLVASSLVRRLPKDEAGHRDLKHFYPSDLLFHCC